MPAAIAILPAPTQPRARQVRSQLERFLQAAKAHGSHEYTMFSVAFAQSVAASEVSGRRMSDINFKSGQVHIARLKDSLDFKQVFSALKAQASSP